MDAVLDELDKVIENKTIFEQKKETEIQNLKQKTKLTFNADDKFHLYGELFKQYIYYQADSALVYVQKRENMLDEISSPARKSEIKINLSEVYSLMGMYSEAIALLQDIDISLFDTQILNYYYNTFRKCYGWLAEYTSNNEEKNKYLSKTNQYRDSIIKITESEIDRGISQAEKYIVNNRPDSSLVLLEKLMRDSADIKQLAYINFTMSEAYGLLGDIQKQIYYLAKTAIIDIESGTREYASLQKLANLIYETDNIDRAYNYLSCSMEDAVACNARLRFIEVTRFYPIIDKNYKIKEHKTKMMSRYFLLGISILSIFLIAALFYLYSWAKKISVMRHDLTITNKELQSVNKELEQTGRIKEVYIGRYLYRCATYLDRLEQYRRSLAKLAMKSKVEEMYFNAIKSGQFIKDERKEFYNEFDKSFIELHPNFITKFNNLLAEDARIYPKNDDILTPELRIFALIRLGITDSHSISHFLGYSLTTIYNYRSKLRNKAINDKENFEQNVMKI